MTEAIKKFRRVVWQHYKKNGRKLPWRDNTNPYWVLISEVMLQQTQVARGLVKFPEFISRFPDLTSLAQATTAEVLTAWQGLGYNRRALYLKRTAEIISKFHDGKIPNDIEILKRFPGIGPNTAASILTFAFNEPCVFIETNVRTVFLDRFFPNEENISDAQLMPFIVEALDKKNPREWYWALMDYGTFLKKEQGNSSRRSRHYTKQTKFEGSLRQLRGHVVRLFLKHKKLSIEKIQQLSPDKTQATIEQVVGQLLSEGFIEKKLTNPHFFSILG
jgi:A/G-specific adenine glycosylase